MYVRYKVKKCSKNRTFGDFRINIWALNVKVSRGRSSSCCWGQELTWMGTGDGGGNGAKFGKNRRFGKLAVDNKKG